MTPSSSPTTAVPESLAEVREAVLDHPGTVGIVGAGTAADWAGTPEPPDTVIETTALSGVVTHNPGDLTVQVRAGTPLRDLQEVLAGHGQRVALDPARAGEGATLGGLFATADAGPRALAFGSLRDLVIGATVVLADGTVARSGGHVIKNVAGYDLAKLLHGAQGTLGVVADLVLRLHPSAEATATVALPCERAEMAGRARAVADSPVEAAAIQWIQDDATGSGAAGSAGTSGRLLALLEGTAAGVEGRAGRLVATLGAGAEVLSDPDADAAWTAHARAVAARPVGRAVLRLGVGPSQLTGVLDGLTADTADTTDTTGTTGTTDTTETAGTAGTAGTAVASDDAGTGGLTGVTASPSTGVATVALPATTAAVAAAHRRVAAAGGTSTLRQRPAGTALPAFGPAPSSAALLRAVAASLDPDHRFGRGRLAAWLTDLPTGATA